MENPYSPPTRRKYDNQQPKNTFQQELQAKMRERKSKGLSIEVSDSEELDSDNEFMQQFNMTSKGKGDDGKKQWAPPGTKNDRKSPSSYLDRKSPLDRRRSPSDDRKSSRFDDDEEDSMSLLRTMKTPYKGGAKDRGDGMDIKPRRSKAFDVLDGSPKEEKSWQPPGARKPMRDDEDKKYSRDRSKSPGSKLLYGSIEEEEDKPYPTPRSRKSKMAEENTPSPRPRPRPTKEKSIRDDDEFSPKFGRKTPTYDDDRRPKPAPRDPFSKPKRKGLLSDSEDDEIGPEIVKSRFSKSGSRDGDERKSPLDRKYNKDRKTPIDEDTRKSPYDKFRSDSSDKYDPFDRNRRSPGDSKGKYDPFNKDRSKERDSPFADRKKERQSPYDDRKKERESPFADRRKDRQSPLDDRKKERESPFDKNDYRRGRFGESSRDKSPEEKSRKSPFRERSRDKRDSSEERDKRRGRFEDKDRKSPFHERARDRKSPLDEKIRDRKSPYDDRIRDRKFKEKDDSDEERKFKKKGYDDFERRKPKPRLLKQEEEEDSDYDYGFGNRDAHDRPSKSRQSSQEEEKLEKPRKPKKEVTIERESSICEDLERDPTMRTKQTKESKAIEKDKPKHQTKEKQLLDEVIDSIKDAQHDEEKGMKYIDPDRREQESKTKKGGKKKEVTSVIKTRPQPRYGRPDSARSEPAFDNTLDIRDSVYQEWRQKRMIQAKKDAIEKKKKEKEEELKKVEEKKERQVEAKVSYQAWVNKKKESGYDENKRKKIREEERKKKKEEQEKLEKRKDAEMAFRSWKEEKDILLKEKKRAKRHEDDEKFETEENDKTIKQKDAERAFKSWKERKQERDNEKKQAELREQRRKEREEEKERRAREREAQEAYDYWNKKKEKQKAKEEMERRRRKEMEEYGEINVTPPWRPNTSQVPFGR